MTDGGDVREAEIRVQDSRRELEQAAAVWLRDKRDAAVSGKGLLAAVAAGFVVGGVLRGRKSAPRRAPPVAAAGGAAAAGGGVLGMVAGLAMTLLRMRYGDPLTAASSLLLKRRRRAPPAGVPSPRAPGGRSRDG